MRNHIIILRMELLLAMFACVLLAGNARAIAFFTGRMENGNFVPQATNAAPCFEVRYCTVKAALRGATAETTVELTVIGDRENAAAMAIIPLPDGIDKKAVLDEFPGAKLLDVEETQNLCQQITTVTRQPGVMTLAGQSALLIPELVIGLKTNVVLHWSNTIRTVGGICDYTCPLSPTPLSGKSIARLTANVSISNAKPVRGILSPTHALQTRRPDAHHAELTSVQENWTGAGNFRLLFATDDDPVGLRLLAFRDTAVAEDGYFLLFGCPSGIPGEKSPPKDIAFVLDTSGSMRGEKFEQAQAAVAYCLNKLNAGDHFNIITFGTDVRQFRAEPVAASADVLKAATAFMEETVATGRTNIGEALRRGQAGRSKPGRLRIMVFLTDGTPTAGELVPDRILERFAKENESRTRVFVVGVGYDVNAHLLDRLAELTEGSSEYVAPDEDMDIKVAALYDRLDKPFLTDVHLDFGELKTASVFPKKVPALFQGSELMVAGRYKNGGRHAITLSGTLNGEKREYRYAVDVPEKIDPANRADFVASLWASRNIGFYLQEIRLHGQKDELVAEVVRLSRQFGIVTEYTAFLADAGPELSPEKAVAEVRRKMKEANEQQTGQWAVQQAKNDAAMQQKSSAAPSANSFRDSRGEMKKADKVRMLGRRALYLKDDGQWVDSEAAGDRTNRTVKAFSPEYFELMKNSEDFRQATELGENVTINIGNERIVVEK